MEGGFLPELIGQTRARRGERAAVFKLCRGHRSLSIPGTFSWESTALGFLRVTGLSKHGLDLVLRAMAENKRLSKHRDSGVDEELGGGPGGRDPRGVRVRRCICVSSLRNSVLRVLPGSYALCMPVDRKHFTVFSPRGTKR